MFATAIWPDLHCPEVTAAIDACWDVIARPGLCLDAPTRLAVAAQSRAARDCPRSKALAAKPFEVDVVEGYEILPGSPLTVSSC